VKSAWIAILLVTCAASCGRRPSETPITQEVVNSAPPVVLPPSAMRIEWKQPAVPAGVAAGSTFPMNIEIRNAGDQTWPVANSKPEYAAGRYAVRLSYRWCASRGMDCPYFEIRRELSAPLEPGGTQTIGFLITAPPKPGAYELQFDAVQELVAWFGDQGNNRLTIPLQVE